MDWKIHKTPRKVLCASLLNTAFSSHLVCRVSARCLCPVWADDLRISQMMRDVENYTWEERERQDRSLKYIYLLTRQSHRYWKWLFILILSIMITLKLRKNNLWSFEIFLKSGLGNKTFPSTHSSRWAQTEPQVQGIIRSYGFGPPDLSSDSTIF